MSGQKSSQPSSPEIERKNKRVHKPTLDLEDAHIENIMYKQCVLSSLFIEYHALPIKAGKSEFTMLQMAIQFRSGLYYEIYQEFKNNIWSQPGQNLLSCQEFVLRMQMQPMMMFIDPGAIRQLINVNMNKTYKKPKYTKSMGAGII